MDSLQTLYVIDRVEWRDWLEAHFETAPEIWLIYPRKATGKPRILYNDAVEEALCFGWIDSTVKSLDEAHTMQRFCPRRPKSGYSQPNKERLSWLLEMQMIHPSILEKVKSVLAEPFHFPEDILQAIQQDATAWQFFQSCPEGYKRIRLAYIDAARKRPDAFETRLHNFLDKCAAGKIIKGFGGIEKYYK